MDFLTVLIYFTLGLLGLLYFFGKKSRGKNYPPGPWSLPIIGNVLSTGNNPHKKCMEWSKKYGSPVIAVDFASYPAVVISDAKLVREAFNTNDNAARPDFPLVADRCGGIDEGVIFTSGAKWMEQRRFILRTLRDFGFGKNSMETIVHEEVKDLIEAFRRDVGKPVSTQNRFNAAVLNALWTIVAGERFKQDDPELEVAINHLTTSVQENSPITSLSMFMPFVSKMAPELSGYKNLVEQFHPIFDFLRKPIQQHRSTYQEGQPRDFIDSYLDEVNKCKDKSSSFYKENGERSILYSVFDLFLAGAETTSTTLTWTFLYLAKYPKVQKKLQAEIQRVVGDSRLPSLSDRPNMPYTEAVIHEVMRFSSLVPLGVMHSTTKETEIGGYTIPKNTMLMSNIYAIHYDESIWGDPDNFRPERFLNKDGVFTKHTSFVPFSVGKRACLGESLARDELFLFTASLFQAFQVLPATSANDLSLEANVGGVLSPLPHELILKEIH